MWPYSWVSFQESSTRKLREAQRCVSGIREASIGAIDAESEVPLPLVMGSLTLVDPEKGPDMKTGYAGVGTA